MRSFKHLFKLLRAIVLLFSLTFGIAACAAFQTLSIESAVAQLVPNDPAVFQGSDRIIGDDEIKIAVEFWIKGEAVPRTRGERINDLMMKRLVELWAESVLILPES
jgi:hypothetical protein